MIEVRRLTKRYGSKVAVDALTFDVRPGVVTGFLGPNGSGKSTTMRLIVGLDAPDSGYARIGGRSYRELRWPLREVGSMLEAKSFHPGRAARAHLAALAASNAIGRARVDEVLEMVGLASVARGRAGTFSLGMAQRLGIAAALLGDPPVLLFDEPANGLDPEGIRWIRTLMRSLAGQGRTVFVSSHLLAEMANTADRLVVIGRGRLIAATTMTDFLTRSGVDSVRVRTPHVDRMHELLTAARVSVHRDGDLLLVRGASTEQVGDLAAQHGITLHELVAQPASLEEAYMNLTEDVVEYRATGARS